MRNIMIASAIFLSCCFFIRAEIIQRVEPVSENDSGVQKSIFANDQDLYKLCSLYCYATRYKDGEDQLTKNGWNIKNITWDQTIPEILSEIEKDPVLKSCFKGTPISPQLKSEEDTELKSLYEYYENTTYDKVSKSEQHYGFVLGHKEIDGRIVRVIAFRGTDDFVTWFRTNFIAVKTPFLDTNTYVHTGFEWYRKACMERSELRSFIDDFKKELDEGKNPLLIVTGHSLGGAAAVLESAYLVHKEKIPYQNIKLITSGEATPGRISFVKHFAALDYTTFINTKDIVPYILTDEKVPKFMKKLEPFKYHRLQGKIFYFTAKSLNPVKCHLIQTYQENINKGNYEEED